MSIFWSTVISVVLSTYLVGWSVCSVSGTSTTQSGTSYSDATCQADGSDSCKNGALMVKPNLSIEIYGEMYHFNELPDVDSKVVTISKDRILGTMNLVELIDDFGSLGDFINLAYNGAVAAGPKFIEMQLEIQDIGFSITNLFDLSALTINSFKTASETVLVYLQSVYEFLLTDFEQMAFATLSSISEIAQDMIKAAQELQEKATIEKNKLIDTSKKTERVRVTKIKDINENAKRRQELERKKEELKERMQEARIKQTEAENKLQEFNTKEEEAISNMGDMGLLKNAANFITSFVGIRAFSQEDHRRATRESIELWKQKSDEAKMTVSEYNKERFTAFEQMIEFAAKIKDCEGEENMAEAAVDALHEAIGALKQIVKVMQSVIYFWKQIQQYCEFLASDTVTKDVQLAINTFSKEKRLLLWTSIPFKRKATFLFGQWVAINVVCSDLVEPIKLTRENLLRMLIANPTPKQSHDNVKDLATKFLYNIEKKKNNMDQNETGSG